MVGRGGRCAAYRGACLGAQDRAAVRRVGRVLRGLRQPAGGLGEWGGRQERRGRQPGRDGRVDRGRALRPEERQGPGDGEAFPLFRRAVQGARLVARPHGGGQSFRGQQLSRALQHLHQIHRGGDEEAPRRAHRPGDRVRPEDGRGRLLLYGQPGQRPGERRRAGRLGREHDLLHHRKRFDHQLPLRPYHQVRNHHGPLRIALPRHGRERGRLPRRHPHGRPGPRDLRAYARSRLGRADRRRARRTRPGLHLARLETDQQRKPRPPRERERNRTASRCR